MKFLRLKDVVEKTGLPRSTIYQYMANGQFPSSIKLGIRSVAWSSTDVDDWMKGKLEQ